MRLLSCERHVPLARPPGLRLALAKSQLSYDRVSSPEKPKLRGSQLVSARPQLSCVRALLLATPMPRDWQLATPRLSYVRASSPAKQKLRDSQLVPAKSQPFSDRAS